MNDFDPNRFVDDLGQGIAQDATDDVRNMIFSTDALAVEIMGFVQEAKDGLWKAVKKVPGAADALEAQLKAKKTAIVSRCPAHVYSVERLVGRALDQIVAKAREISGS